MLPLALDCVGAVDWGRELNDCMFVDCCWVEDTGTL